MSTKKAPALRSAWALMLVVPLAALVPPGRPPRTTKLDAATLECQDASTSGAIIDALKGDAGFGKLSTFEGDAIVQRDEEDAEKLQKGVDASVAAGVLPKLNPPPTYQVIDVLGKTPDDVCAIATSLFAADDGVRVLRRRRDGLLGAAIPHPEWVRRYESAGEGCYVLVFVQLFEKYGTLIERCTALIEKVSA